MDMGGRLPSDGAHVYLTDTLESPHSQPQRELPLIGRALAEEHRRALRVKEDVRVLVCIGNPPYDRQEIGPGEAQGVKRKGGWVRNADAENRAQRTQRPILEDFLEPARQAGQGIHLKNLYNDYVYFWRWALWKVFETSDQPGIVTFITASSYLRGPGFVGMRELMRRTLDELWIIDLEGDQLGARKTENVFAILTPVAIAVGVRYGQPNSEEPARVHYTKITGTHEEKLTSLANIETSADLQWRKCFSGWMKPFLPEGDADYFSWPAVTDLFPWQHSGVQLKRTWPIGETRDVLRARWVALMHSADRANLFRETDARRIRNSYEHLYPSEGRQPAIYSLAPETVVPPIARYGFRSLDRQWILRDSRIGDRIRPPLWLSHSNHQVYMTSLLTGVLGAGPAATITAEVPDLHYFSGRGGKDIIPLWRDAGATKPNVTHDLLEILSGQYGRQVSPEDLFAYAYSVLASPAFMLKYSEELTIPGPRLPLTKDRDIFSRGVGLGRRLIHLHTYGERFVPADSNKGVRPGRARITRPISARELVSGNGFLRSSLAGFACR